MVVVFGSMLGWAGGAALADTPGSAVEPSSKGKPSGEGAGQARPFVDVTDRAGVRHRHHKAKLDSKLDPIMPWMASVGPTSMMLLLDSSTSSRLRWSSRSERR